MKRLVGRTKVFLSSEELLSHEAVGSENLEEIFLLSQNSLAEGASEATRAKWNYFLMKRLVRRTWRKYSSCVKIVSRRSERSDAGESELLTGSEDHVDC